VARAFTPVKIVSALVGLLVAAGIVLYLVPSNDYLLLPDPAHPVAPLVHVQGGHDPRPPGAVYFVDVFERRASMFEKLFPSIHKGATLVPARLILPPGVSDQASHLADLREMTISQRVAAAVALRQLGYHVVARPSGVVVAALDSGSHAIGKLQPSDVIVSVDGVSTPTIARLRTELAKLKPGDPVTLAVRRGDKRLTVRVRTTADAVEARRAIVGFAPEQAAEITLPIKVQIDAGNVGGPSAGLAFALEVMEELGRNVDRGYKVAATGQLNLDGTVSPIGGVRQKIFGVRAADVDVFLVPAAGDNAAVARRYAAGVKVIAVKTFPQALRALATLPRKR
jgi:PDZ domain-containing protein